METISVSQPVVIVISSQRLLPLLLGQPSVQLGLKVGEVIKVLRVGGVRGVRVEGDDADLVVRVSPGGGGGPLLVEGLETGPDLGSQVCRTRLTVLSSEVGSGSQESSSDRLCQ